MGTPGPKPKPNIIKRQKGEKLSRINDDEPEIVGNFPARPVGLGKVAVSEYNRIKKQLIACPYVTTLDRGVLVAYCTAWEVFVESYKKLKKFGYLIITKKGNLVQNPALSVNNRAKADMVKYAAELGFTP